MTEDLRLPDDASLIHRKLVDFTIAYAAILHAHLVKNEPVATDFYTNAEAVLMAVWTYLDMPAMKRKSTERARLRLRFQYWEVAVGDNLLLTPGTFKMWVSYAMMALPTADRYRLDRIFERYVETLKQEYGNGVEFRMRPEVILGSIVPGPKRKKSPERNIK